MRVMIAFVFVSIVIGPCIAHIAPPYDGCIWGISGSELSIEPGDVISDAVLTIEDIRPDASCLIFLTVHLQNPRNKLIQTPILQNLKSCLKTIWFPFMCSLEVRELRTSGLRCLRQGINPD